jgi:cytochrome b6-f complex iron-sulfur subunit
VKQQQRRVFLKVIAISPLVGCGPDPSARTDLGGGAGNAMGGSTGAGSNPAIGGGGNPSFGGASNPSFGGAGNTSFGGASNPSFGGAGNTSFGGSSTGGSQITTGGQSGAHAAGGTSPGGASSGGSDPNDPSTPIGNVSAYPLGSFSIAGTIYFLGHDAGGLYAMTMACTHAGCACAMKGNELDCPCHGSRFDHLGNVLQGPATKPLPHFPVFVDATGNITVDRFTIVSQSTRTKV